MTTVPCIVRRGVAFTKHKVLSLRNSWPNDNISLLDRELLGGKNCNGFANG